MSEPTSPGVVSVREEGMDEALEFRPDNLPPIDEQAELDASIAAGEHFSHHAMYAQTQVPPGPSDSFAAYEHPEWFASLDANHQKLILELQQALPSDLGAEERAQWDVRMLRRYLVAREWNLQKAKDMMLEAIQWRLTNKPLEIKPEDVADEFLKWTKMVRHGFDKNGRPVIYVRPTGKTSEDWDTQLRHLVWNLENAIASMQLYVPEHKHSGAMRAPAVVVDNAESGEGRKKERLFNGLDPETQGVEQLVWIVDWNGFSLSDAAPFKFGKTVLQTLQLIYPERLYGFYCFDAPFMFRAAWAVMSPVINAHTKKKIHFLTGSIEPGSHKYKKAEEVFDLDFLEVPYCGRNQYSATGDNIQSYWQTQLKAYERRMQLQKLRVENFLKSADGEPYRSKA